MSEIVVCALYKFVSLENYRALQAPLRQFMQDHHVRGTLILADEGINGTVAASRQGVDALLNWLRQDSRLADLDCKESFTDTLPFKRAKVKIRKEIVTLGVPGIDPRHSVGTYLDPTEWNQLLADPDVLLVDTRNDYEYQVGSFRNAVNPQTVSFRELPRYVREHLDPQRHRKIAMFCTGGIRCEKSTAYMKTQGFDEVYHLKGGILKYLEETPQQESLWEGECFVFDERVTVNHRLEKGSYDQCNACRMPITQDHKTSDRFQQGVSCPHCYDRLTASQKMRFRERQKQMELARRRGQAHMGDDAAGSNAANQASKLLNKNRQRTRNDSLQEGPDA
ncbi:MAG: rhodanese-related sulfurtransferase [Gammaproteobacteria bacterium]